MVRRILIATDVTAGAVAAIGAAVSFASTCAARLIGLYVRSFPPLTSEGAGVVATPESDAQAGERFGYVERRAAQAGVGVDVRLRHVDGPAGAILASARDLTCDLIVMGAHGRRSTGARAPGSQTAAMPTTGTPPVPVIPFLYTAG